MNRLFGESHWDLNELTINYRNPQEVSELASRFAEEEGLYISTVNAVRTIPDSVSRNVVPDMSSLLETTAEQAAQLMPVTLYCLMGITPISSAFAGWPPTRR